MKALTGYLVTTVARFSPGRGGKLPFDTASPTPQAAAYYLYR